MTTTPATHIGECRSPYQRLLGWLASTVLDQGLPDGVDLLDGAVDLPHQVLLDFHADARRNLHEHDRHYWSPFLRA